MSWTKERSHRKNSALGVRCALRKIAKNPKLKFVVTLGPDVLRATGWRVGDEIEFYRGDREHAGWVRLVPGRVEAYRLRQFGVAKNGDKLTLAVWAWDTLPSQRCAVTQVDWSPAPDVRGIDFRLPSWALPSAAAALEAVPAVLADVLRWLNENGIAVVPIGRGYSISGQRHVGADKVLERANAERTRRELPPFAVVMR